MKHLPENSVAYKVDRAGGGASIRQVRIVLQHPTLGAFFDDHGRAVQAWHGELHATREEAQRYAADAHLAAEMSNQRRGKRAANQSGSIVIVE